MRQIKLLILMTLVWAATTAANDLLSSADLERIESAVEDRYDQPEVLRSLVDRLSEEELIYAVQNLDDSIAAILVDNLGEKVKNLPATIVEDAGALPQGSMQAILQMLLPILAYEGNVVGIKEYQADLGNEPTGVMTVSELFTLQQRVSRVNDSPVVSLNSWSDSDSVNISVFDGHLSVEGTWVGRTHKLAYPINTAEIKCWKGDALCIISESHVDIPDLEEEREEYFLDTSVRRMKIVSWTENEVTALSEGTCRSNTLTISLSSNEVYETVKNNWSDYCEESSFSVRLPKPQVDELVPGAPKTNEFWEKRNEIIKSYYNSRLKARLEEVIHR